MLKRIFLLGVSGLIAVALPVCTSFAAGDNPVVERLRCSFNTFDADYVDTGVNGVSTAQGPRAEITPEGVVIVDRSDGLSYYSLQYMIGGVEYDATAANYSWSGAYDDYELTVEFWWKRTSSDPACLFGIGDQNVLQGMIYHELTVNDTGVGFSSGFRMATPPGVSASGYAPYSFEAGQWYHLAFVTDPGGASPSAGTARVYVNGQLVLDVGGIAGYMRTVYMTDVYWHSTEAVIQLGGRWKSRDEFVGGDIMNNGGLGPGPGLGVYDDFVITTGLKYEANFTPPPRSEQQPANVIPLVQGWTSFGITPNNPFAWSGLLVKDASGTMKSLAQAEKAGWLQGTLYYYAQDQTWGLTPGDDPNLDQQRGYYIWSAVDGLSLLIYE